MDIKPYDKTIREILLSRRKFVIPRFQREYSWDEKNYKEFLEDMLNRISILNGSIVPDSYFLGTMLFIGNYFEGNEQEIEVVDGQQRLTTITILFSVISDIFLEIQQKTLSNEIFKYIMTTDDNGNEVRILQSKTHYPFFAYFIQEQNKEFEEDPASEEEESIKETYDYLKKRLNEKPLRKYLEKKNAKQSIDQLDYVDILKGIRDQVLNSIFVSISTKDKKQANMIFEILNGKGKRLASLDLVKNKIFEKLIKEEPVDRAEDMWSNIKNELTSRKESIGFATYYRHFWSSKYNKTTDSRIYDDFLKRIHDTPKDYDYFLVDLLENAKNYMCIINPARSDYDNRKEYYWLVQSLYVLNEYFNIVQVRIALLAIWEAKKDGFLDHKLFKSTIQYLENFHFAYNAILSGSSNRFEQLYSSFAIALRKCESKQDVQSTINNKLITKLDALFPSIDIFTSKFIKLEYSKHENQNNVKVKYILNKLNCFYLNEEIFSDTGSVEHILPEKKGIELNIGNLILLEQVLNIEAGNLDYIAKKSVYLKSNYKWIKKFVMEHDDWCSNNIENRALEMAKMYYTKVMVRLL